jgi:hypothetical protein
MSSGGADCTVVVPYSDAAQGPGLLSSSPTTIDAEVHVPSSEWLDVPTSRAPRRRAYR